MSEFDELVALDGVLMAGRLGQDGRIAESKTASLYVTNPDSAEMAQWFCSAITSMFGSMAYAVDRVNRTGFDDSSWLPVKGWAYTGGDYSIVIRGDRFMIAERAKLGSFDQLDRLLGKQPAS
jgi:roadblock/LC7 domain-containing protein